MSLRRSLEGNEYFTKHLKVWLYLVIKR